MDNSQVKHYPNFDEPNADALGENHSLVKMLRFIGTQKHVLDVGCATGYLARLLATQGCSVVGLEINPEAAQKAEQFCERVVVADLDRTGLQDSLAQSDFDVIVFGDVLEHLRDPWDVLKQALTLLRPEGYIVASIPNIAHGAVRLSLLKGDFQYSDLGLLDNTHLRFFTRSTIEQLFEESGYLIKASDTTVLPIFSDSDLIPRLDEADFSGELIESISQDRDSQVLQFVIKAVPATLETRHDDLKTRYYRALETLKKSEEDRHALEASFRKAQASLEQERTNNQSLIERTAALEEELLATQKHANSLSTELEATHQHSQSLEAGLSAVQAHSDSLSTELEATRQHAQSLESGLSAVQAHSDSLGEQLNTYRHQVEQLGTALNMGSATSDIEQLVAIASEMKTLKALSEKQEQTIQSMERSKFWQLRQRWLALKQMTHFTSSE